MTDHPQVYVKKALGYVIDPMTNGIPDTRLIKTTLNTYVDEDVVIILTDLWSKGVHTLFSCQGDEDNDPYVMFGLNSSATAPLVENILKRHGKVINVASDPGHWEESYWRPEKLGHITWIFQPERVKIKESEIIERKLEIMSDVDAKAVRAWAKSQGKAVKDRGRLPKALITEYQAAIDTGTAEAQEAANAALTYADGAGLSLNDTIPF